MNCQLPQALALSVLLTGCINISHENGTFEPRTITRKIEKGSAELVRAGIHMGAGTLEVRGGSSALLDAEFHYETSFGEPEVTYEETSFRGRLDIRPAVEKTKLITGGSASEWKILLGDNIPLDLDVALGAGQCDLKLAGLTLRSVELKMGAGECEMDLTGNWQRNFDVKVRGGIGELTVRVPSNVGVVAEAEGGIGEISVSGLRKREGRYFNEAYGESPITIRIDVKGGVGEINLVEGL